MIGKIAPTHLPANSKKIFIKYICVSWSAAVAARVCSLSRKALTISTEAGLADIPKDLELIGARQCKREKNRFRLFSETKALCQRWNVTHTGVIVSEIRNSLGLQGGQVVIHARPRPRSAMVAKE
jgi:hypothetical protein